MGKKILFFVGLVVAMVFVMNVRFVSAQDSKTVAPVAVSAAPAAPAAPAPAATAVAKTNAVAPTAAPAPQKVATTATSNRAALSQIGFGFNGIPLDGSHIRAIRMRRAYRSSHGF